MSGIFGIISPSGTAVAATQMQRMADALSHRGPDGVHYLVQRNAAIGQCMLYTTSEALLEQLPLRHAEAGLTLSGDVRLDNRDQLLSDLALSPAEHKKIGDCALILHSYLKWGEACVDHLLGDFAFAIWDERTRALFVARDPMGCKPLYYHSRSDLFVFASSAMAVARVAEVRSTLDEGRLADYLLQELEGINKTCSWYKEVGRMPPGYCGHYRNGHFQPRSYWTLQPSDLAHLKTDDEYREAFTPIYQEAVRSRLRCQTEPASMLSGGLDSSTIVAMARDLLVADGRPALRTYSGISERGETCPETNSIEKVVAYGGLNSTRLRPSAAREYRRELAHASRYLEDPFDTGWDLLALMFLLTARDGGRVLLSGLDGELAAGAPSNYLAVMLRQGQLSGLWQEARGLSKHYYRGHYSPQVLYLRAWRARLVPDQLRTFKRWLLAPQRYRRLLDERPLSRELARQAKLWSRVQEYDNNRIPGNDISLQHWFLHASQVPFLTAAIERYERLASYFGVEVRHPLLDTRLLAFSAGLPLRQKVRGGWSKWPLRQVAVGRLPDAVAWREGWEDLGDKFNAALHRTGDNGEKTLI